MRGLSATHSSIQDTTLPAIFAPASLFLKRWPGRNYPDGSRQPPAQTRVQAIVLPRSAHEQQKYTLFVLEMQAFFCEKTNFFCGRSASLCVYAYMKSDMIRPMRLACSAAAPLLIKKRYHLDGWEAVTDSNPLAAARSGRGSGAPLGLHSLLRPGFEPSAPLPKKRTHPSGWILFWQGQKDSNPQERFWRPLCYHYIMPLNSLATDEV